MDHSTESWPPSPAKSNTSSVAHLEVQKVTTEGEEIWEDVGPIHLTSQAEDELVSLQKTNKTTAAISPEPSSSNKVTDTTKQNFNAKTQTANESKHDYKKLIPLHTKNILSPPSLTKTKTKTKTERKSHYLYRHSSDSIDTNLLLLFHGAGDSHVPYHSLSKSMVLPQTASLSISASSCSACDGGFVTLPFGLGYTWFDEMDYIHTGAVLPPSHPKRMQSLNHACRILNDVLDGLMMPSKEGGGNEKNENRRMGWVPERIFLLGYSAGASLVMETCLRRRQEGKCAIGGAVCVAGGVRHLEEEGTWKSSCNLEDEVSIPATPVLVVAGSKDETFPPSVAKESIKLYNRCNSNSKAAAGSNGTSCNLEAPAKLFMKEGKKHEMLKSPQEIRAVMEFLADKLVRRMVSMEGLATCASSRSEGLG